MNSVLLEKMNQNNLNADNNMDIRSFDNYQFRCSMLGKLMVTPRAKADTLSVTTRSHLNSIFTEMVMGKSQSIKNKYLEKGILMEDDSIQLYGEYVGRNLRKNTERYTNRYITGEPDIIDGDLLVDIKSSWSAQTFPLCDTKVNKDYYWQLQGYMELTGIKTAKLVYCLVDTPEVLIQDEIYRVGRQLGYIDLPDEVVDEIRDNLTYNNLDKKMRVKEFNLEYNLDDMKLLYERIAHCRNYLNYLLTQFNF